jgi:hypothetical protein
VAKHADLLPSGSFTELITRSGQVAKLLTGYLVYLDRQIADTERAQSSARATESVPATLGSGRALS